MRAEKTLKAKPDDSGASTPAPWLGSGSGRTTRPSTTSTPSSRRARTTSIALELRAIAQARLGKKEPALADLARYQKGAPERSRLYLAAVVAAELGDGTDAAIEALEAALRKEPGDADLRYDAARAFALASKAVDRADHAKGAPWPGGRSPCFKEAVRDDDLSFALLDDSSISTRSGATRRSPGSSTPDTPNGATPASGRPRRGSRRRRSTASTPPST